MIYQTTNPTKMIDALLSLVTKDDNDLSDILIFVPTQRSARSLEKSLVIKMGGAVLLPKIVPLGEADDSFESDETEISNVERKIILAKLVSGVGSKIGIKESFSASLSVASELVQLTDYLENEGIDAKTINWFELVKDERKAKFLDCIKDLDFLSNAKVRNQGILNWIGQLSKYNAVYCVGSTASVASTRKLMKAISSLENGHIIFPGFNTDTKDIGRTDPYWSIKKFLDDVKQDVKTIDVGANDRIKFFNNCFSNDPCDNRLESPKNITMLDCATESEEANVVARISSDAAKSGKKVIVITPDVSGEQRIKSAISNYGLSVDSSGGTPLFSTDIARFVLGLFDLIMENEKHQVIEADTKKKFSDVKYTANLKDFVIGAMHDFDYKIKNEDEAEVFFDVIYELSPILAKYNLEIADVYTILTDALKNAVIRGKMDNNYDVTILGTAEARMQTSDVVIITGLNDGMFPKNGFQHNWLPRDISYKIGLPSSDSKVSLMALDFMTLSCGDNVYWTRSKMSGNTETLPSRFLSRVLVKADINKGLDVLNSVRAMDNVEISPVDNTPPVVDYNGIYYATWLDDLIHNPYLFYAKHILRLKKNPDVGDEVGAKEFGTFVHSVLEECTKNNITDVEKIIYMLEQAAAQYIDKENILFRFWQNRFREMAPIIATLPPAEAEKEMFIRWSGKELFARADRIENGTTVVDYKTGTIPTNKQLGLDKEENCTMPQLPLEAMMLGVPNPTMAFLSLKKNKVDRIDYDQEKTALAIEAVKKKLTILFKDTKYDRPEFVDDKYKDFDDLCRAND